MMSTYTDDRRKKIVDNLYGPVDQSVTDFSAQIAAVGVRDPRLISAERMRSVLSLQGRAIDAMSTLTQGLVEQRSRLSFIIDALGPNGENILSENGILLIRAAEAAYDELDKFESSQERILQVMEDYKKIAGLIDSGLDGFTGISSIIDNRPRGNDGRPLPFDLNDPRDAQLMQTFKSCVDQWVDSQLGDPRLKALTPDELLIACGNFEKAHNKAFDLSHPDQVGSVVGRLSYSMRSELLDVPVDVIEESDGTKTLYKCGIPAGPRVSDTIASEGPQLGGR